ncbi:hypothetical protein QGN29_04490 [Temperatibacter marinus]|uniref:Uncharacterized protein n=1 Tax=Temperatibacter marinus TaxID=1456591 RepID=A0AA52EF32_9PROT|nr:hypothetical protein [Temperatibacter marinus]WND03631.1 hypothetical protein QGN29_04490 [Temperatibacter marinus]
MSAYIYHRKESPSLKTIEDIQKLPKLVSNQTFRPETMFGSYNINLFFTNNDLVSSKMLMRKRADYIIGWNPDQGLIMDKADYSNYTYNPNLLITEITTHFACNDSETGRKMLSSLNKGLVDLKKKGLLTAILSKYAKPVPLEGMSFHRIPFSGYTHEEFIQSQ